MPTFTPAASALIHNVTGINVNNTASAIKITAIITSGKISNAMFNPPYIVGNHVKRSSFNVYNSRTTMRIPSTLTISNGIFFSIYYPYDITYNLFLSNIDDLNGLY